MGEGVNALEWDRAHLWRFRARLVRIVDADTLVTLIDCGYRGRHEPALRLARIQAPELGTPEGKAAAAWLAGYLGAVPRTPWPIRVQTIQRETVVSEVATFERWVSEVWWVEGDGTLTNLSDALVAAGHAVYRDY